MGVLQSLSGLQMYRRAVRRPIEGPAVVRFLLEHDRFPRAVRALLREIRRALGELPDPSALFDEVDEVDAVLRSSTADGVDGAELDDAMEALQLALAQLDRRVHDRYLGGRRRRDAHAFPGHAGRCRPLLGWRLVARIGRGSTLACVPGHAGRCDRSALASHRDRRSPCVPATQPLRPLARLALDSLDVVPDID